MTPKEYAKKGWHEFSTGSIFQDYIEPFAKVIKEAQLEAYENAAKICDEQTNEPECPERAAYCAKAIRDAMNKL